MILIPVSVFDVVDSEYATLTPSCVLAATYFGSGKIIMFDGGYPTLESARTDDGTCIKSTGVPLVSEAISIIHSYVVSAAACGVYQHQVSPAI